MTMLFDLVRELNDEINLRKSQGLPVGVRVPYVFGVTDGYIVQVTFMDRMIWDSSEWEFAESSDMESETARIRQHLRQQIRDYLFSFYHLQID